jgi:pyruvate/2-oxoglutarate dehydrogenase complex dihydrolipoamide dehydrogenase (E3) component
MGIAVDTFAIDFAKIAERRNKVVKTVREEIRDLLEHHRIDIYTGQAVPQKDRSILIREGKLDVDGETMHFTGKKRPSRSKEYCFCYRLTTA